MYSQDKWNFLNLKFKSHYHVLIHIWYNGLFFLFLKSFMKENSVNIKRWLQSLFDFRPFYPYIVWEVGKLHTHTHTHTYIPTCVHVYI